MPPLMVPELGYSMQEYLDELRAPVLVVQDNARTIDSILLVGRAFFTTVIISMIEYSGRRDHERGLHSMGCRDSGSRNGQQTTRAKAERRWQGHPADPYRGIRQIRRTGGMSSQYGPLKREKQVIGYLP